jgi:hypothetical protein
MMRKKILFVCLMLLATTLPVLAQKKIVLENIRYSTAINYLHQLDMQQLFASNLNAILVKHLQLSISDTSHLPLTLVKDEKDLGQKYDYRNTDSSILHLLIDIFEIPVDSYFDSPIVVDDNEARKTAKTVFHLNVVLIDADNNVKYNEPLYLVVKNSISPGMGNESTLVKLLPKTFVEVMKAGLNIILNPNNELEQVTVTVAPAFLMDNYLVPALANQPRIYADTAKKFMNFFYKGKQQMLRYGQSTNEEVVWKGKNARKYPQPFMNAIRNTDNNANSVFLFMGEEQRDVLNNRNYQMQLMVQIPPLTEFYNKVSASDFVQYQLTQATGNGSLLSNFVEGQVHLLLQEKDTLAIFNILTDVTDNEKLVFPNRIYNGVDSSSAVVVPNLTVQQAPNDMLRNPRLTKSDKKTKTNDPESPVWSMVYVFLVEGKISGHDFIIKYGGFNRTVKEFYLDKKLVCIAQGRIALEKFVVFDASLPTELLNQLLLLGFSNYFR